MTSSPKKRHHAQFWNTSIELGISIVLYWIRIFRYIQLQKAKLYSWQISFNRNYLHTRCETSTRRTYLVIPAVGSIRVDNEFSFANLTGNQ